MNNKIIAMKKKQHSNDNDFHVEFSYIKPRNFYIIVAILFSLQIALIVLYELTH